MDWKLYQEAYRRGILPPDKIPLYEEAMARGLVDGQKKYQQGEKLSWSDVPGKAMDNFLPSAGRVIDDTIDAITSPIETGKAVGKTKSPKWLIRTKLMPASQEPLVGKKHPQGLTYGKGIPTQEIVGELIMNGTLVAHIGQGWREPIVPGTPVAEKISIANYQYAIGNEAKAPDLEELAAQIGFEAGKVIARDGKPLPEKKKKKE